MTHPGSPSVANRLSSLRKNEIHPCVHLVTRYLHLDAAVLNST